MAGSSTAALMPSQKVGTDFLASSHFSIAQDCGVIPGTLKSVFKKDYVPWEVASKPPAATPPQPAAMLQKDTRYFNQKASETKHSYEYRALAKPEMKTAPVKLSSTNFKMDSDPRLKSFTTTHTTDYSPKSTERFRKAQSDNPMESFIPQGDPGKAPQPLSDYRDQYRGRGSARLDKAGPATDLPPTIQGDRRQHHFSTTHSDVFRGQRLPRLTACPAPQGSNIPQGDQDKEAHIVTTHQVSFPRHGVTRRVYDKTDVTGKLALTNFKQTDGHGAWDSYLSTMTDSYQPVRGPVDHQRPDRHRNHSDFPAGDEDPSSNAQRANMTTNRFYLGNPARTQKPAIVSGSDKRTRSNVWFGEPRQGSVFYDTTTDSTFRPVSVPYSPHTEGRDARGGVPLDYYADNDNNTTYRTNFYNPDQGKTVPNPVAINKLKASHIGAPLGGSRWFATEHLEQFTPKQTTHSRVGDPGRLQRSSVPIGTLNV